MRGTVPRAVPGLLRLFAPRESMEDNPFDEVKRQQIIHFQGEETANNLITGESENN